jgi:hypothetical protein
MAFMSAIIWVCMAIICLYGRPCLRSHATVAAVRLLRGLGWPC